jgi:protein-S-isoprenylcysteine O-methyltransferase Ste14
MLSGFGWAALALLFGYLALFFWGSAMAAEAAGRHVWLFARASGRDRWAAAGFRAAFAIAFFGPLIWMVWPALHKADPLWMEASAVLPGVVGIFIAGLGAMLAFAAQMSMGTSWRVGVVPGETGELVSGGLYRFSRNPTFVGQFLLLAGLGLAIPSVPTLLAALLFLWSAVTQVRSEEEALRSTLGEAYDRYAAQVPRWIGASRKRGTT